MMRCHVHHLQRMTLIGGQDMVLHGDAVTFRTGISFEELLSEGFLDPLSSRMSNIKSSYFQIISYMLSCLFGSV
jgi:hypothetical protein